MTLSRRFLPVLATTVVFLPVLAMGVVLLPGALGAQTVARLEARPVALTLEMGGRGTVEVTAYDAAGAAVDVPVRLVGPRRQLRVRGTTVEALEVGDHELVATAAGEEGPVTLHIPVVVTWPAVTELVVVPGPGRLYAGTTVAHGVTARHADGSERPNPAVRWTSSDPSVATVDDFGHVTAHAPGRARIGVRVGEATAEVTHDVAPLPASTLRMEGSLGDPARPGAPAAARGDGGGGVSGMGGAREVRTGDVLTFRAVALDDAGRPVQDAPVTWSHSWRATEYAHAAASAAARLEDGRFVADLPGLHTVVASVGPLTARTSFRVHPRDVVRELDVTGHGLESRYRTTDFWVFEGLDGRDYAVTGSKKADGHAFVYDVTDPANIVKTDSVQVDARTINDVKVSPDGRYATMTREGASDRRNGVVLLDLADPAHPVIASQVTERLTGGVHNAFPTDTHVFALSNGDKYVIIDVADLYAPRIVSEYDHPDSRVHDVWVHDGLAFSAEWETGVVVVDVGNGRWGGTIEDPVFVTSHPLPTGGTHAVFPYFQEETGKYYLFVGDEIMSREGLAWAGYPRSMGSYADQYDPETGLGGVPLTTRGYIQVIDFTDPDRPEMVARYQVPEYGTHNIWVEDDVLYQAYYEGGLRVVDVSGELMGNLYTQGREMAVFKSATPEGYTPNATMVWSAMPHKGHVFFSDTNSGLWSVRLEPAGRPIS